MANVHELNLDRYAPDGSVRHQDIKIRQLGGLYGFYGAKWIDHDTHAWIEGTSTSKQVSLGRLSPADEIAGNFADNYYAVVMAYTIQGLGKFLNQDGRQDLCFFDTATSPDNFYLVRVPGDSVLFEMNIASGASPEPNWGPCFLDRDWAYIADAGGSTNYVARGRFEGGVLQEIGTIARNTIFTNQRCRGVAWNGRDVAVVSHITTVSPPSSYRVDVFRVGVQGSSLVTWTRSYGGGDLVEAVDIDWNGREWLVYWTKLVDTGA